MKNSYLIIGEKLSDSEVEELGLSHRIGKGEVMIKVPKEIIDDKID
mgnify:CR=1 FL=1